jgi:CDP-diacylglycerol--glycerol-3-phosphate 3-phosphatidyltransferase
MAPTDYAKSGMLRLLAPLSRYLVKRGVSPNAITTVGTALTVVGGVIYGWGHIHLAGWIVGLSAICDLLDGEVARRSGRTSVFGAFYDSTLDRIADGVVLGGLALFFSRNAVHGAIPVFMSTPMVSIAVAGMVGSFLTSYTRARAEGLGIEAKVGILQRPERIILLSAPQAFFGLALGGWVLMGICALLALTAWITVIQRIQFVYLYTVRSEREAAAVPPGHDSGDAKSAAVRAARDTEAGAPREASPLADVAHAEAATRRGGVPPSTTLDAAR